MGKKAKDKKAKKGKKRDLLFDAEKETKEVKTRKFTAEETKGCIEVKADVEDSNINVQDVHCGSEDRDGDLLIEKRMDEMAATDLLAEPPVSKPVLPSISKRRKERCDKIKYIIDSLYKMKEEGNSAFENLLYEAYVAGIALPKDLLAGAWFA